MAKITLDTVVSGWKSVTKIISNFTNIATHLNDKVLYRDNVSGNANEMNNLLDMNGYDIINVGSITTGGSYSSTAVTHTSGALVLDYDDGSNRTFVVTVNGDITGISFLNVPTASDMEALIEFRQSGAYTITWTDGGGGDDTYTYEFPAAGTAMELTSSGEDIIFIRLRAGETAAKIAYQTDFQ